MTTQRNKVLALLQQAGNTGVNSYDLTYTWSIKQAPTRVKELREMGYQIISRQNPNRSVTYVLLDSSQRPPVSVNSTLTEPSGGILRFVGKVPVNLWNPRKEGYFYQKPTGETVWRWFETQEEYEAHNARQRRLI